MFDSGLWAGTLCFFPGESNGETFMDSPFLEVRRGEEKGEEVILIMGNFGEI